MRSVPRIDSKYWLCLCAASIFGTNTGDFLGDELHLGHLSGLPWLAGLFALILLLDRAVRTPTLLWFWFAIITVRTAATNIGDMFHDWHIDFLVSIPLVLALFIGAVWVYRQRTRLSNTIHVTPIYWVCMILAGVLGTLAGDFASFRMHLTPLGTAVVVGILVAMMLISVQRKRILTPVLYWTTVALIRTAGTGAGDALSHTLTLPWSTLLTGFAFLAPVIAFYVTGCPTVKHASPRQNQDQDSGRT
jgi:uncharacterized membrane-anchored protein